MVDGVISLSAKIKALQAVIFFSEIVLTEYNIRGIIACIEVSTAPYPMVRDKIKDLGL